MNYRKQAQKIVRAVIANSVTPDGIAISVERVEHLLLGYDRDRANNVVFWSVVGFFAGAIIPGIVYTVAR